MTKSVHTKNYARFLQLLVQVRKNAGITQEEVAARLGRHQSFVSKYENGERRVDLIEFLDIAEAIGFEPVSFMRKIQKSR
ncbi:MAG TPA: helix-turn-helix transcriptional regulator [Pyrinomonadaceae bacterium]|nr:helix-turn-helix transcriptional regulator [Pyrinomonadaceae bacterium]